METLGDLLRNAQIKLAGLGIEPRKPSPRHRALGTNPSNEMITAYDTQCRVYNNWRTKYLAAKKSEVAASNALYFSNHSQVTK